MRPRVHVLVSDPSWDTQTWKGDIWGTSESESSTHNEADVKEEGAHAAPLFKSKMVTVARRQVRTGGLADYSPEKIKNLLDK